METLILNNLLHNEAYTRSVIPHLKKEYFYDTVEQRLFTYIEKFFNRYNKLPTTAVLNLAIEKDSRFTEDEYKRAEELLPHLENPGVEDLKWLIDETENFCKQKSVFNALTEAIRIKENFDKPAEQRNKKIPDIEFLPELLSTSLNVSFDKSVGHDYFEDYTKRWDVYHSKETKIPFDIDILNRITKGGVEYKTLNIIMAGVNVGKSLGLCHLAAAYLSKGYNVLYISMEMGEIGGVAKRIDANLMNMTMDNITEIDPGTYKTRIARLRENIVGNLIIKQYPTAAAHVGHFKALINELKQKKNFVPQIVIIDYLGICASTRVAGYSENSYHLVKCVAEEIRGMAIELDVCVWSAAQTNRGAWGESDIDMADVAESAGLPATCDFMLGVIETEDTIKRGQQMFKQIKSRYGNKDIYTKFMIGVDKDRQKWYDTESSQIVLAAAEQHKIEGGSPQTTSKSDVSGWKF